MLKHSYVPSQFELGIIVPLVKTRMAMFVVQITIEALQSVLLFSFWTMPHVEVWAFSL